MKKYLIILCLCSSFVYAYSIGKIVGLGDGIRYSSKSQNGIVKNSEFKYKKGEVVTFKLGKNIIGSTQAKSVLSIFDLVKDSKDETNIKISNITRLLQSLDNDNNLSNGISVDEITTTINFDQDTKKFEADKSVKSLSKNLKSLTKAREYLKKELLSLYAMRLRGTFTGKQKGHINARIDPNGKFRGAGNSAASTFTLFGHISSSGVVNLKALAAGTPSAISTSLFTGTFDLSSNTIKGTWKSKNAKSSGTWEMYKK